MPPDGLGWELESEGRAVGLTMQGQRVVQEVVSRHPVNWGWILYSQGTVWAQNHLPPKAREDPFLRDGELRKLPSELPKGW